MSSINGFALFGNAPKFNNTLPVGQLYFPSWNRYRKAMEGIFERRYYTNHGPLVQKLEENLQEFLGVKHVICVTNATIGLIMAAEALGLTGKVLCPSFTFIASPLSISWAGLEPVFCDVDSATHQIDITKLDSRIDEEVTGIMGVNLWGSSCDQNGLAQYALDRNLKLYFDSAHAFGCVAGDIHIGNFGEVEVFSFHATKILSATEGGCLCTNDNEIADRLRNIRSSYGIGKSVPVVKTSNGRMSEAQAAIALLSLEDYPKNRKQNKALFDLYEEKLRHVPGVKLVKPSGITDSNFQYIVCEIDKAVFGISRDSLIRILKAENVNARRYFYPGAHNSTGYLNSTAEMVSLPVTDYLCSSCIQLPVGALVSEHAVEVICEIIRRCQNSAELLKPLLKRVQK